MPRQAVPELPEQAASESATIAALEKAGYTLDFGILDTGLCLDDVPFDPSRLDVERTYRFEGTSDPDYQSLVLALRDRETGERGVLVTAYGPTATGAEARVLRLLGDDPRHSF